MISIKNTSVYLTCLWTLTSIILSEAFAQINTHHSLKRIETPVFQQLQQDEHYIYLPMGFNRSEAASKLKNIQVNRISAISLVYTQYRQSERFNQLSLNEARTAELFAQIPELKAHPEIQWYWIAQTGCTNPEPCKSFFHGFEIRLKSDAELTAERNADALLDYYESISMGEEPDARTLDSLTSAPGSTLLKSCDTTYIEAYRTENRYGSLKFFSHQAKKSFIKSLKKNSESELNEIQILLDPKGQIIQAPTLSTRQTAALNAAITKNCYFKSSKFHNESVNTHITIIPIKDKKSRMVNLKMIGAPANESGEFLDMSQAPVEYKQRIHCNYTDTARAGFRTYSAEKVVTEVLKRNAQWKNCLIATDVTGSMTSYLGQFLAWHKMHLETDAKNSDFVFFNDGNNMPDYLKRPGHVGGVYYLKTDNYKELKQMLSIAQRSGSGGDGPENNVEAIIKGISENPQVSEVILIADNLATPRDLSLLKKINKPIHIVLCGANNGINLDYLNMARENGGTVHTIEQDLLKLASLKEGASFSIDQNTYRVRDNKIEQVKQYTSGIK